eukprot:3131048-Rhodomonas_salina.1
MDVRVVNSYPSKVSMRRPHPAPPTVPPRYCHNACALRGARAKTRSSSQTPRDHHPRRHTPYPRPRNNSNRAYKASSRRPSRAHPSLPPHPRAHTHARAHTRAHTRTHTHNLSTRARPGAATAQQANAHGGARTRTSRHAQAPPVPQ